MRNRILCMLLLSILLITAACGGGGSEGAQTQAANPGQSAAATTEAETEPEIISKALPTDKKYDGFEFNILTTNATSAGRFAYEFEAEEQTGEVMNDAVYTRNTAINEQFGVKIKKTMDASYNNLFTNAVQAGDDVYDVLSAPMTEVLQRGYTYGLAAEDLPYVDIDRSWWDQVVMDQCALGGVHYALTGDINLVDDDCIWLIYFNKRLGQEYKVGDLYKMVYDGKWTIDALKTACANASVDLNGDGVLDYKDQWGLVASKNSAASLLWAAGGSLGKMKPDHTMELTMSQEHNINVMERIFNLFADKNAVLVIDRDIPSSIDGGTNWTYSYNMFINGRSLFYGYPIYTMVNFREMEDDFGYLPCPKYDEDQKEYYSIAQEWVAPAMLAPRSASDPERTSIILEAMASAGQYYVVPAYYDVVLARKYARDDQSAKIIDILRANRQFDLVYAYNFGSARNSVSSTLTADSNTIASTFASIQPAVMTAYETTYQAIIDSAKK